MPVGKAARTKDQIKCANLSIQLDGISKNFNKELGFVRTMKKLAKINEAEHGDNIELRKHHGTANMRNKSLLGDSLFRSNTYNINDRIKKINTSHNRNRYGSSLGLYQD